MQHFSNRRTRNHGHVLSPLLQAQTSRRTHLHANALQPPKNPLQSDALERGRDLPQQENIGRTQSGSILTRLQQAGGVDPDTFISSNNKLNEQLRRLKQEKARLLDTDSDDLADRTRDLMDVLEDGPDFLGSFDAELFDALVEKNHRRQQRAPALPAEKRAGTDGTD